MILIWKHYFGLFVLRSIVSYIRFEDGPEDLEATISNPVSGPTGSGMMSVADQSEILDL